MAAMIKFSLVIIVLFFVLFSTSSTNGLFEPDDISLSKEEEFQVEKQFHSLNKPAIRTIQMKNGDLYDCVDFYKQPGFDHPSLKNHTFSPWMKPSIIKTAGTNIGSQNYREIKPMRVDCPSGTVPIRRITKDDLLRAKLHEKRYRMQSSIPYIPNVANPGSRYAIASLGGISANMKFMGIGSAITPFNLSVGPNQYSLSRMRIQRGPDIIEVGFMVNPSMYNGAGDVHFYIRTKTSKINCFNVMCPGFILANPNVPVDPIPTPVSQIGGPTYTATFFIHVDIVSGNWLLKLGQAHAQLIGYWPASIFAPDGLTGIADSLDWGGEVFSPARVPPPPMGCGIERAHPTDSTNTAFCCRLMSIDGEGNSYEVTEDLDAYTTPRSSYTVQDEGIVNDHVKHVVSFGGKGGEIR